MSTTNKPNSASLRKTTTSTTTRKKPSTTKTTSGTRAAPPQRQRQLPANSNKNSKSTSTGASAAPKNKQPEQSQSLLPKSFHTLLHEQYLLPHQIPKNDLEMLLVLAGRVPSKESCPELREVLQEGWEDPVVVKELKKKKAPDAKGKITKGATGSSTLRASSRTTTTGSRGTGRTTGVKKPSSSANTQPDTSNSTPKPNQFVSYEKFYELVQKLPNRPSMNELKRDLQFMKKELAERRSSATDEEASKEETFNASRSPIVTKEQALQEADKHSEEYQVSGNDLEVLHKMGLLDLNTGKDLKESSVEETDSDTLSCDEFKQILQMTQEEDPLTKEEMEELMDMMSDENGQIQPDLFVEKVAQSMETAQESLQELQKEEEPEQPETKSVSAAKTRSSTRTRQVSGVSSGRASTLKSTSTVRR